MSDEDDTTGGPEGETETPGTGENPPETAGPSDDQLEADADAAPENQAPKATMDLEDMGEQEQGPSPEQPESKGEDAEEQRSAIDLEPVFDVPVNVQAVLGRSRVEVSDLLKLGPGTVVELDRKVGEAIDIYVNDRLVARGEVVLVEDHLGVTMTEIIKSDAA